jgi:hypothetical protein
MNKVFANRSDEDKIYTLTTVEIAAAQRANASLKHRFKRNAIIDQGLEIKLIENTTCVCKDGWLVIPKPLQVHAVKWYHHYLHYPGYTRLEETMNAAMYWKGMHTTIWSLTKSCKSCQVNKRRSQKYGPLPPKTVYTIPWNCLCVDHIGPYTNTTCVCKDGWLVIPKPLQVHAVKWYHHYLQHPGHTRLKETMNAAMH